jgi:hypothetical protein
MIRTNVVAGSAGVPATFAALHKLSCGLCAALPVNGPPDNPKIWENERRLDPDPVETFPKLYGAPVMYWASRP